MYKTILVPLENSPCDRTILSHVSVLARLMGSRLILVHVADGVVARNQDQFNLEDSEEIRVDRAYLESCREQMAAQGFEVTAVLERGEPAPRIAALAEREKCDLIAMATHGHRIVMDVLLGSVAEGVRHRTPIPVLLVRGASSKTPPGEGPGPG